MIELTDTYNRKRAFNPLQICTITESGQGCVVDVSSGKTVISVKESYAEVVELINSFWKSV